jgi:L-threonylcarbamoyladenylate synthase
MVLIDREYVESHKVEIIDAIRSGAIFIYPTDTIYGIGCNALMDERVKKIREIKHRDNKTMSLIAPSKEWMEERCVVDRDTIDKYLPGPYTFWMDKREGCEPFREVNPNEDTLWVRIPGHWFSEVIAEARVPFVTTSVNVSGTPHMEKIEDVPQEILDQVDYVIYEGEKKGQKSEKIILTKQAEV